MNVTPVALTKTDHFGDVATARARQLGHCFCLGLDPHLSMIPSAFHRGDMKPASSATIGAIEDFLVAVVDQTADRIVAYKPQSAMYERLGSPGIALLERHPTHRSWTSLFGNSRRFGIAIVGEGDR
jgi:hypothetical protein